MSGNTERDVSSAELEELTSSSSFTEGYSDGKSVGVIYLTMPLTKEKIETRVKAFLLEYGCLFFPKTFYILTERIVGAGLKNEVQCLCRDAGYVVEEIDLHKVKGEYIGSDGGGHYSTDFYEFIVYGRVSLKPL